MRQKLHATIDALRHLFTRTRDRATASTGRPTVHHGSRRSRDVAAQALREADAHLLGLAAADQRQDSSLIDYYPAGR